MFRYISLQKCPFRYNLYRFFFTFLENCHISAD